MQSWIFTLLKIALFVIPVFLAIQGISRAQENTFDLDELRWKKRVLLVFSPSESNPSLQVQREQLASHGEGVGERDLKIVYILEHADKRKTGIDSNRVLDENGPIRSRFGIESGLFQVLLIGKDGTVKLRSSDPVSAEDIFALIDSMPMRRQEMKRQGAQ